MALSTEKQIELKQAIKAALDAFSQDADFEVFTDFHLHLDADTGVVTIFDDDDVEITDAVVEDWIDVDGDEYVTIVGAELRSLLKSMSEEGLFNNVGVAKPFSFVLIDDDKETIEELFLVDDDTILISPDLLSGLDQELDDFFNHLLDE